MARNIFSTNKYKIIIFTLVIILGNFNFAKADTVKIGDDATAGTTASNGKSVLFTGTEVDSHEGVLIHDAAPSSSLSISDISTDHDGVGIFRITNSDTLIINGDVGSAAKRIDTIDFQNSTILAIYGSIYTKNGIITSTTSQGDIDFFGRSTVVNSKIGASDKHLVFIKIANSAGVTFSGGDIFVDSFVTQGNSFATINGSGTNSLGSTTLQTNSTLNLNQNTLVTLLSMANSSTINIAAGKTLTGSGALSFDGNLRLGIIESDSSTPSILSTDNINLANGLKINFDYSQATYLKQNDQSSIIVVDSPTNHLNVTTDNLGTITDNSILLKESVEKIINAGSDESLVVTYSIDSATTSALNKQNLATVNFLLDNTTATGIDSARTALLKISTQSELENTLKTLQVEKNNMTQKTSLDIANAVDNVIGYRVQSLNYDQFVAFDKKDPKGNPLAINNKGLWGQVFGNASKQNDVNTTKGYDANFGGVSFGLDKVVKNSNSNSIWGGALSYAKANANSRELSDQKTDINSYQFSLYNYNVAKNGLGFFNENSASVAYNQYDTNKNIVIGSYQSRVKANFSGTGYGAKIGFGYNYKIGDKTLFAPIAGIKYSGLSLSSYKEKNDDGLGLKVQNDSFNLFTSELGFKVISGAGSKVQPQLNISWLRNLNVSGAKSHSTFINGANNQANIQNRGIDLDANILNAGAQLNFKTSQNTSMFLKYDLQKSSNFTSHLGSVQFNLAF
ncbi:MAG: autotransporter outer membrane beta-barrel domain-containing protein [Pseudomonadota bacterium]